MKEDKYLPIGTVVLLKKAKKKIMIIGYAQKAKEMDKIWDYAACLYPEGYLSSDRILLFDNDQIDKIYFKGYKTEEEQKVIDLVKKVMQPDNKK